MVAIATGSDVQLFSGLTGILDMTIENIFNDHIMAIGFDPLGLQFFVAGDRQIRVFHNITGYKVGIEVAKEKLKDKKISMATRERLELQVADHESFISQF